MKSRCLADLDALDEALDSLLAALDGDDTDGEINLRTGKLLQAFQSSWAEMGCSPDEVPEDLLQRGEAVLAKYAVASSEVQRRRSGLADELKTVRTARRRLSGVSQSERTGEECDMRG